MRAPGVSETDPQRCRVIALTAQRCGSASTALRGTERCPVQGQRFATPGQEAAVRMAEHDIGAVLVGSVERLEGVLTDRDVLLRLVVNGS
jgi:hypothetical protein